jgi:spore germination protein GerM
VAKRRNYDRNSGRRNSGSRISNNWVSGRHVRKQKKTKLPGGLIFWAAFLVLIAGLFFINRDHIRQSLENTQLLEKMSSSISRENSGGVDPTPSGAAEQPPVVQTSPRPIEQRDPPSSTAESVSTGAVPASEAVQVPPAARPVQTYAEQVLYFIRVSDDGEIIRSRVVRRIPVSGTPLQDTLEALIAGPDSAEISRGMLSLLPPNTKILSAVIDGNTARINFSEEFQYNTAGMEGFIAQLIQIIWTATEFPNVQNVQILIEGNRIDHLGEGIPIWNPLNRQSF